MPELDTRCRQGLHDYGPKHVLTSSGQRRVNACRRPACNAVKRQVAP